jgi:hypothetical protein
MPETIYCSKCKKAIKVENFPDQMSKLRHHYARHHPKAFKESVAKGIKTRKAKK